MKKELSKSDKLYFVILLIIGALLIFSLATENKGITALLVPVMAAILLSKAIIGYFLKKDMEFGFIKIKYIENDAGNNIYRTIVFFTSIALIIWFIAIYVSA